MYRDRVNALLALVSATIAALGDRNPSRVAELRAVMAAVNRVAYRSARVPDPADVSIIRNEGLSWVVDDYPEE